MTCPYPVTPLARMILRQGVSMDDWLAMTMGEDYRPCPSWSDERAAGEWWDGVARRGAVERAEIERQDAARRAKWEVTK